MNISAQAEELRGELSKVRRQLHRIPETAFEEKKTSEYIFDYLTALAPDSVERLCGTGVKAVFYAQKPLKTIAFRADIDALPVSEHTGAEYASTHKGCMHACGHDGHMAILLGLARYISALRRELKYNIVLIFQPAEEFIGGAKPMIDAGALKNPDVDEMYGLHLWPDVPHGLVGIKAGFMMADVRDINIDIEGKSAHGAQPQNGIDAIVAASQLIVQLQTVASRSVDPISPCVLTFGRMEGGNTRNIIAQHARLEGTIRCTSDETARLMDNRIDDIIDGISTALNVKCTRSSSMHYPAVINPMSLCEKLESLLDRTETIGAQAVMIAEDFAYYQREVPAMLVFMGVGRENSEKLHSSKYDFDEDALVCGLELWLRVVNS